MRVSQRGHGIATHTRTSPCYGPGCFLGRRARSARAAVPLLESVCFGRRDARNGLAVADYNDKGLWLPACVSSYEYEHPKME